MAEHSTTPALPPTADTNPYVPVSWMAVAALGVAAVFLGLLLVLGVSAFREKKPLIMPVLLVFPVVGVVLSFAGRRLIRNAEGTRTGEGLVNAAWWMSLVGGLAYAAYLFAIDYSVRRDAESEVQRWVGYVVKDEPNRAFVRLLDPARRTAINPDNEAQLDAEFPNERLVFKQCDLIRLAGRNKGASEFVPGGLKDWAYKPTGIDCVFSGTIKCPEGTFPFDIALKGVEGVTGVEGGGGRQWTVVSGQNGFFTVDKIRRTPYGWLVFALEATGGAAGKGFISAVASNPEMIPYIYHGAIKSPTDPVRGNAVHLPARLAAVGGLAATFPFTRDHAAFFPNQFFKLRGGTDPAPDQKAQFMTAWTGFGVVPAGTRLSNSPDINDIISVTDTAVEVRVPCELPLPGGEGAAARCRLVVACTDPAVLAELKDLRSRAKPDEGTTALPEEFRSRSFPWRVVRLETDLYPVRPSAERPMSPGAGRMPGGR